MKTIKDGLLAVALSTFLLNLSGCGKASDRPELGHVTGVVTLDDKPLKGIEVVFSPDTGRPARGKTNSEGKYELTYIGKTRGAKVGRSRVEIAPNEEGEEGSEDAGDTEEAATAKPPKPGKIKIPARYNTESKLEADVQPGENVFDFKLESK